MQRLATDPFANGLAIGILLALTLSAMAMLFSIRILNVASWMQGNLTWLFALITSLVATALASTLLLKASGPELVLKGGITLALGIETVGIALNRRAIQNKDQTFGFLVPLVVLVGIAIAGYLSSVEVSSSEALCGLVGDCNAVQQSPYARLFGILPVGIMGIVGYIGILFSWLIGRLDHTPRARLAQIGLRAIVLFGVIFSIYLTFLEPFIIGAVCAWCLTSSVIMLLLLWLTMADFGYTITVRNVHQLKAARS
ncbi:MAG: vitamin K epoxide reductase family protein [Chloroflexota bacterium]